MLRIIKLPDYYVDLSDKRRKYSESVAPKLSFRRFRRKDNFGVHAGKRGGETLLFSNQDIDLLRLLRWCSFISCENVTSAFPEVTIQNLRFLKMITIHQKSSSFVLTGKGNKFLDDNVDDLPVPKSSTYREAHIQRRLHVANLTMTAYRSGMSVFHTDPQVLEHGPSYYLTAQSRVRGFNPWGSTRVAALARLGNTLCAIHYIFPDVGKITLTDEINAFNNNTAGIKNVQRALILAGKSYKEGITELDSAKEESGTRKVFYWEAYRTLTIPVYILACDDTGALQLRIMAQPDYRRRLTMAALKSYYQPPPKEHPEWNAMFDGAPFVMAVDMDLRRIDAAIESARMEGFRQIAIAALDGQVKAVLNPRYRIPGLARVFTLAGETIASLGNMTLYTPSTRQFETREGGVIDAPIIQTDRISGRHGKK